MRNACAEPAGRCADLATGAALGDRTRPRADCGRRVARAARGCRIEDSDRPTRFTAFTALVADDNPVNREVACEALAQLGASVETVENGIEAVAAVASHQYDIVFMDGSMPVLDGFEATHRIRAA